jgi:oxygen-independent coproporphyrinogen-3 oxidase
LGLYIHIPFCAQKCPYCDFYSIPAAAAQMDAYCGALIDEIKTARRTSAFTQDGCKNRLVDTVYFGGGTPSVFGTERIAHVLQALREEYTLAPNAEITVECNPSCASAAFFEALAASGVNRVSLGLQSAIDAERRALGRIAGADEARSAVLHARQAGITNISLDLMLGIPRGNAATLRRSIDFSLSLGVPHISAYMLKIEEDTPFAKTAPTLGLPDDDAVSDMYLFLCDYLNANGLPQYEISNFAQPGFESRHNLKYWNCEEYLGLGPAAHSFVGNQRFFFARDIAGFLEGSPSLFDSPGGSFSEYAMLRLRLAAGLSESEVQDRFHHSIPPAMRHNATIFAEHGMLIADENGIRLTPQGFLLSNTIINTLLSQE